MSSTSVMTVPQSQAAQYLWLSFPKSYPDLEKAEERLREVRAQSESAVLSIVGGPNAMTVFKHLSDGWWKVTVRS